MALRAGYQGFKKLLPGLKLFRPGCLGIDDAELSKTFYPRSEESLMGATNILPTSIASPTVGEATATLNADKSVTINTSGATAADRYIIGSDYFTIPAGTWYFSGNKSENTAIDIYMQKESDGSVLVSNNATDPTPKKFVLESATSARLIIKVKNGQTVSNKTVYPMIALSANAPYAPYAMTNEELTEVAAGLKRGDTLDLSQIPFSGFISSGSAEVTFLIPLKNSLNSNSIPLSFNNATVNMRGIKGYLKDENGDDINADFNMTGKLTMAVTFRTSEFIRVLIKNTNNGAFLNVDNNTPVNVQFGSNARFTFS